MTFRLHTHVTALRYSLLASLGLGAIACGGAYKSHGGDDDDDATGGGGKGTAGHSLGGTKTNGGASTAGASTIGGAGVGGKASNGGAGPKCTMPSTDPATGLVTCGEGYVHRPKPQACDKKLPSGEGGASSTELPRAREYVPCFEDTTKCDAFQYGYCDNRGEMVAPGCRSGCITDADCGTGSICECGHDESPTGGACRSSTCVSDADCSFGTCANYEGVCGGGGFACHSPKDECVTQKDCMPGGACAPDDTGRRQCRYAACGRPFLVQAEARLPPVTPRSDWSDTCTPSVAHLSSAERATLAEHWSKLGQMEHASIAAFARFQLQLLALGAPANLVELCNQALADETAHAKLCFGIASAYAGRALGPGPLDVSRSLDVTSLADIVDLVIVEGCIGETSATLEALEAADAATDPVIRAAYARIAADEQRHAELAFRFVQWALQHDPTAVAPRLAAAAAAPHEVVTPCLQALLAA